MLKKFAPFALAAVMAATLAGCPETNDELDFGGGAGVGERQDNVVTTDRDRTPAEQAAAQDAIAWGTDLTGDKRALTEGFTHAAWMQGNLASGEWEQAGEDLADLEDQLMNVANSADVPAAVRAKVAEVGPLIDQLGVHIANRDQGAIQGAQQLTDRLSTLMTDQTILAWMGEDATGGGAGAGVE